MERLKTKSESDRISITEDELRSLIDDRISTQTVGNRSKQEQIEGAPPQGFGQNAYPPTITQESIEYINSLEPGIPERIRQILWGLVSIQNQFTQINSPFEQMRLEAGIRASLTTLAWEGNLTASDISQIEVVIRRELLKSRGGIERRLLAPQLTEQVKKETILEETKKQNGLLSKLLGRGD